MSQRIEIAPSFLPRADFGHLAETVRALEEAGANRLHLDVMDGQFVPNLTFGAPVIASVRPVTKLPFEAHLMVLDPARLLPAFIDAGCDVIILHPEAGGDMGAMLKTIKAAGKRAGLALKPQTNLTALTPFLDILDHILILTVEPGFGGQTFMSLEDRIGEVRRMIDGSGRAIDLEVDGGINATNAARVVKAGAKVLVAGSFVFKDGPAGFKANIQALKG